jgi:adenylate cyclase
MAKALSPDEWWRRVLTGDNPPLPLRHLRRVFGAMPSDVRCQFCNAPYQGWGAPIMRVLGKGPSPMTPRLCRQCHDEAAKRIGGCEVEVTLLFADVRGSTPLAERLSPAEFSRLINRFYAAATDSLVRSAAWVDRLVGDQAIGIYVPGFAGPDHTRLALTAAQDLLRATGHAAVEGPWLPIGVGIHRGTAFVGAFGSDNGVTDITVLGDVANVAARLSSLAAQGEILVSEPAFGALDEPAARWEERSLALKGKSEPVRVRVGRVSGTTRPGE